VAASVSEWLKVVVWGLGGVLLVLLCASVGTTLWDRWSGAPTPVEVKVYACTTEQVCVPVPDDPSE